MFELRSRFYIQVEQVGVVKNHTLRFLQFSTELFSPGKASAQSASTPSYIIRLTKHRLTSQTSRINSTINRLILGNPPQVAQFSLLKGKKKNSEIIFPFKR